MRLKQARRGRNAGGQFWSCSRFPRCRGTQDVNPATDAVAPESPTEQAPRDFPIQNASILGLQPRVDWSDGILDDRWERRYMIGGGSIRAVDLAALLGSTATERWLTRITQVFLAVRIEPDCLPVPNAQRTQVVGTVRKILQRGDRPPLDPEAEIELLVQAGVEDLRGSPDPGDLLVEPGPGTTLPSATEIQAALARTPDEFELEPRFQLDSEEEREFMDWARRTFGGGVSRWIYPQASLDSLLEAHGREGTGQRRVDFLFSPPWADPLSIEIDGKQHREAAAVDQSRDEVLAGIGIRVLRIPAGEVRAGSGPRLDEARALLSPPQFTNVTREAFTLVHGAALANRLALAVLEAVDRGWLDGVSTWRIDLAAPVNVVDVAIQPFLELFAAIDGLWAGYFAPEACEIRFEGQTRRYERAGVTEYSRGGEIPPDAFVPDVRVVLDPLHSPVDGLPDAAEPRTIICRTSTLPVRLADRRTEGASRVVAKDAGACSPCLRRVMRYIFAKRDFREGQEAALHQVLRSRDCAVLLPTGAGKSLIYQLAGLIMPGRTLIVDPIIALMEDQARGLRANGIDRVVALSSQVARMGLMDRAFEVARSGDALFCFVAPERLQQKEFRESLRSLTVSTPVNLAVVDEAHCVSEWGHDFRTSYLGLGRTLKTLCESPDGKPPPLIALTGTASRSVLRDVLIELDIDRSDPGALIKPETFDRPELSYRVVRARPGEEHARLRGVFQTLPDSFGVPPSRLYRPNGRRSNLGIVFCPWVNGDFGVVRVSEELGTMTIPAQIRYYSGAAPRAHDERLWEHEKREHADSFKRGDSSILCATKAFGMGIDIPNVRYTLHFGIPGSIESFYQEAGRAGRDRRPSQCWILLSEGSESLIRKLLSDDRDGDDARNLFKERDEKSQRDDVMRQLWFHFNSFRGVTTEMEVLTEVLYELGWSGAPKTVQVPFGSAEELRERAIYRLALVGVVREYLKDWGAKRFEVILDEAEPQDLDTRLLDVVARMQPGRVAGFKNRLQKTPHSALQERVLALSRMLLELVYDTIERSRRRALREVWLLARESEDDATIRRRIEDYFREGELAPRFQALLDESRVDLTAWVEACCSVGPEDSGELRGTTARFLESYPDHPGLLMGRSLAEVLARGDVEEFRDNLTRALESGPERYEVGVEDLWAFATFLLDQCRKSGLGWGPIVWSSWTRIIRNALDLTTAEEEVLRQRHIDPGEYVVVLNRRLSQVCERVRPWATSD